MKPLTLPQLRKDYDGIINDIKFHLGNSVKCKRHVIGLTQPKRPFGWPFPLEPLWPFQIQQRTIEENMETEEFTNHS